VVQDSPASRGDETSRDNFQKAIELYQPIVDRARSKSKLLDVAAMVVSNLCVSYIMNEKNHEAEELMKQLEKEEELKLEHNPHKQVCLPRLCQVCDVVWW
jgi:hypothetical protein